MCFIRLHVICFHGDLRGRRLVLFSGRETDALVAEARAPVTRRSPLSPTSEGCSPLPITQSHHPVQPLQGDAAATLLVGGTHRCLRGEDSGEQGACYRKSSSGETPARPQVPSSAFHSCPPPWRVLRVWVPDILPHQPAGGRPLGTGVCPLIVPGNRAGGGGEGRVGCWDSPLHTPSQASCSRTHSLQPESNLPRPALEVAPSHFL